MTPNQKLEICKQTRKIATSTLVKVLKQVLESDDQTSEAEFRDLWLKELRLHSEIFPDGWYNPPPNGVGILFGKDNEVPNRISYKSLRPEDMWPKDNIKLDKEHGILYLFASPVNKDTGVIGDFGLIVYLGKNPKIKKHLSECLKITKRIFDYTQTGMKFSDIAKYCTKLCQENNLVNNVASTTDSTGTNIGHTIPSTDKNWDLEELEVFKFKDWNLICKVISQRRVFLNEMEQTILQPRMAITIEPRLLDALDSTIPMASFHTIGLFYEEGKKELITGFDEIFKLAGMDYFN